MYSIVLAAWCIVLLFAMAVAANRFGKRRRKSGDWTEAGPKHPTDPPPGFLDPRHADTTNLGHLLRGQTERERRRRGK